MAKTLSVIIASYNTKDLTVASVESVLKEKPGFSLEVIVVDDGSKDESVEALKEIEEQFKNVKVVVNKENLGYVGK